MKRPGLFILFLFGSGYVAYYFYENNTTVRNHIDKFITGLYSADTSKVDSVIVQNNDEISHKTKPAIYKRKTLKPGPFKYLDDYAKMTPFVYESDIDKLAHYLIKPAKNDLEKARLIFSWMAFYIKYDDQGYNTDNYGDISPESVLKRKVAVCSGYSALFQSLCESVGLEGEIISGYAKGYGYSMDVKFSDPDHAWNVLNINGEWKLFDVTWASGYGNNENGKLVSYSKFNDYWFDTNPNEFIFSHFPEDLEWQFNKPIITLNQFTELPKVDKSFFKLGFNADYTLSNSLNKNLTNIVESYPVDYPVKIIIMPYTKTISSDQVNEFRMKSEYADDIAAINNDEWHHFKREGDEFSLSLKPQPGELQISVNFNTHDNNYSTCLKYEVK